MKLSRHLGFYFVVMIACLIGIFWLGRIRDQGKEYITYQDLNKTLESGEVMAVSVIQNAEIPTGIVEIRLRNGSVEYAYVSDVNDAQEMLQEKFPSYTVSDVMRKSFISEYIFPMIIFIFVGLLIFTIIGGGAGGGGGANAKMMNFGKSRAKMSTDDNKVRFKDVAGLQEEKEELEEIVDFLKNPNKYVQVGARIPKGVILVGPPGTGKTLIAKAVAGEAGVPFFSISGSDFVEMFVGVGASRVRDLFQDAKRNAPCIVFIDEIDAVARRRGTGMGGGHDEREQTLNQLLVEMDGFGVNEGIIVLAATNRVDILDPAILRPGRFDRKVGVGTPDVKGRREILAVHSKNKPLSDDVDLDEIARTTVGFTGADLENLMNESAISAAKDNRKVIRKDDVKESFLKVGVGAEKKSKVVTESEKRITAYHEAGHAILFHVLDKMDPVYTVSIIPTGMGAGGYTMPLPESDDMYNTKGKMTQNIIVSLGGRVAEALVLDDITTGASSDIKKASQLARRMVTKYGMSDEIGVISFDDEEDEVFIGRDLAHTRSYSESMASKIDAEVKSIIDYCYSEAERLIKENEDALHRIANLLLEKEKIGREEFEACFNGNADGSAETTYETGF